MGSRANASYKNCEWLSLYDSIRPVFCRMSRIWLGKLRELYHTAHVHGLDNDHMSAADLANMMEQLLLGSELWSLIVDLRTQSHKTTYNRCDPICCVVLNTTCYNQNCGLQLFNRQMHKTEKTYIYANLFGKTVSVTVLAYQHKIMFFTI